MENRSYRSHDVYVIYHGYSSYNTNTTNNIFKNILERKDRLMLSEVVSLKGIKNQCVNNEHSLFYKRIILKYRCRWDVFVVSKKSAAKININYRAISINHKPA